MLNLLNDDLIFEILKFLNHDDIKILENNSIFNNEIICKKILKNYYPNVDLISSKLFFNKYKIIIKNIFNNNLCKLCGKSFKKFFVICLLSYPIDTKKLILFIQKIQDYFFSCHTL